MKKRHLFLAAATALLAACEPAVKAPEAILPIPEPKQVEWQKMETYAFVHFGLNTFNDREWGYGDEDPAMLNPSRFDADQIVGACKEAGMCGLVVVAKHHDGFCLWPTKTTEHNIRHSPFWRKGEGTREKGRGTREEGRDYLKEIL